MPSIRALGGIALVTVLLVGCDSVTPGTPASPVGLTTGTVQDQLRQQQLSNARATPGMQNPGVTNVSPGGAGIERSGTGAGSVGGPVAGLNTTGSVNRPGVGAPETQQMPNTGTRPKKKKKTTTPAATSN